MQEFLDNVPHSSIFADYGILHLTQLPPKETVEEISSHPPFQNLYLNKHVEDVQLQ